MQPGLFGDVLEVLSVDVPEEGQIAIAIDEQVLQLHVQLGDATGLDRYCKTLLQNALRTGQIFKVDSPQDFSAGCQDEGQALVASGH